MLFRTTWPRLALVAVLLGALTACGGGASEDGPSTLIVYSGRNEKLVGPLLDQLKQATGAQKVEVRYGGSAELAAQLLEEGDRTRADLFFSQDAGALGALTAAGRLDVLPQSVLNAVPPQYRAKDGTWVATSARARVIAYDPRQVTDAELPAGVDALVDPRWRGKIGFAPTNASWQAFVTGLRVLRGEQGARDWLTRFKANEPKRFDNNVLILDAVDRGEVPLGLINHYYWYERAAEIGAEKMTAKLHFVGGNDPAGLVNVAGVGALRGNDSGELATKAVEFLVSSAAQRYFADQTAEYPVVAGITSTKHTLPDLATLSGPDIDLSQLASLEETLNLLKEVGLS